MDGYIKAIRDKAGHMPLILCGGADVPAISAYIKALEEGEACSYV